MHHLWAKQKARCFVFSSSASSREAETRHACRQSKIPHLQGLEPIGGGVCRSMRLLLDTCSLLWALQTPEKLGAKARRALQSEENSIHVSPVSFWEISLNSRWENSRSKEPRLRTCRTSCLAKVGICSISKLLPSLPSMVFPLSLATKTLLTGCSSGPQ